MRALAALTLTIPLLVTACKKPEEDAGSASIPKKAQAAPIKVPLVVAAPSETDDLLTLTGTIAANQRSEVTADTQGKVIAVMVDRGTRVKMGDPVVRLDVRSAALSQQEAAANLSAARVQRQNAEDECARAKALLDKGAITKSDWDKQDTQCQSSLSQVTAAEARTAMAAKTVSDGIVRAPFAGIVDAKSVSPGEWVTPGRSLFTLVDDNPLKISLSVPEAQIPLVKMGQHVDIVSVAYPDKSFGATVSRVGAEVGASRALVIDATLDPGSPLVPGMFAEAHLVIGHSVRPVIPSTALVRRGKTWHAFVAAGGELQERIVQLAGSPVDGKAAIVAGITANEQVVSPIGDQIVDGLHVEGGGPATTAAGPAAGFGAAPASEKAAAGSSVAPAGNGG